MWKWFTGENISVKTIALRNVVGDHYCENTLVETPDGQRKFVMGHRVLESEIGQEITVNTWELWSF